MQVVFKNNPGVNAQTFIHQKAKRLQQNVYRLRSGKDRQPPLHRQGHKMRLIGINKSVTTTAHETLLVSSSRLPRRAWEPVNLLSSFPRSAWECNGTSKGCHAERGSQLDDENAISSFPCSAWERNGTSKGYHAERGSQMFIAYYVLPFIAYCALRFIAYCAGYPIHALRRANRLHSPLQYSCLCVF